MQQNSCPRSTNATLTRKINELGVREQEFQLRKLRVLLKRAVDNWNEVPAQLARHCRSLASDLENMPETPLGGNPEIESLASPGVVFADAAREQPSSSGTAGVVVRESSLAPRKVFHRGRSVGDDAQRRAVVGA